MYSQSKIIDFEETLCLLLAFKSLQSVKGKRRKWFIRKAYSERQAKVLFTCKRNKLFWKVLRLSLFQNVSCCFSRAFVYESSTYNRKRIQTEKSISPSKWLAMCRSELFAVIARLMLWMSCEKTLIEERQMPFCYLSILGNCWAFFTIGKSNIVQIVKSYLLFNN